MLRGLENSLGRPRRRAGAGRIPLVILTGYLGAGKTTLLRRLLAEPMAARTALVVNEFAEIGIDDAVLRTASETIMLIGNGCLCCAARSDIHRILRTLFADRVAGRVPEFDRVVVETSGLADPTVLLQLLATDKALADIFALFGLVTVVDAANAEVSSCMSEWRRQVALADRIVVTKSDRAGAEHTATVLNRIAELAPHAPCCLAGSEPATEAAFVFDAGQPRDSLPRPICDVPYAIHGESYDTLTVSRETPVEWTAVQASLDTLRALWGAQLLRVKGIVRVAGRKGPVLVHMVGHLADRPEELTSWTTPPATRLVVIGRNLPREHVEAVLQSIWRFADPHP